MAEFAQVLWVCILFFFLLSDFCKVVSIYNIHLHNTDQISARPPKHLRVCDGAYYISMGISPDVRVIQLTKIHITLFSIFIILMPNIFFFFFYNNVFKCLFKTFLQFLKLTVYFQLFLWCQTFGPQCIFPNAYVYTTHMLVDHMNIQILVYIKVE